MEFDYMATKNPTAPDSIGRALSFAASTGAAVANAKLAPHGLGLAQWAVLVSIWRNGPLPLKDIAMLTGNAPPAASRIVDRMVKSGLLLRERDAVDRRSAVVNLTEKGEALRPLQTMYEQVNGVLLSDLSEEETRLLYALLGRVEATGKAWLAGQENTD